MFICNRKLIALLLVFLTSCTGVFFQPSRDLYPIDYLKDIKKTDVFFQSKDGTRLHGWLLEPEGSPKGMVLFLHGNAENLRTHTRGVVFLVQAGYRVFTFDYRGYGLSDGSPEIDGIYQDAEAALRMAIHYSPDGRVIVFGQSLGGAISVYLVAMTGHKDHIKALIVDSAFSGYRRIAKEKLNLFFLTSLFKGVLSSLVVDKYSPEKYVSQLKVPVVFIHGLRDRVVPAYHSFYLYQKAPEPKEVWFVYNSGHIQSLRSSPVQKRVLQYLERIK